MLPSELLRKEIEEKYNVDLEQYTWPEQFRNLVFSILLDENLEENARTLKEIYEKGFNIGHCGLTSRYISRKFDEAKMYYGRAKLLEGTKDSPNGEHSWTIIEEFVVDSTLMLLIPVSEAVKLGYLAEKKLAYTSARMLSEYEVFDMVARIRLTFSAGKYITPTADSDEAFVDWVRVWQKNEAGYVVK